MSTTEGGDYIDFSFEFSPGYFDGLQHLHLSLCVEPVSRLYLHACGAAFAHLRHIFLQMLDKRVQGSFVDLLCSVSNPKSLVVDVHISEAIELHIVFFGPIASKQSMGVGIDQPRKDNKVRTILLMFKCNVFLLDPLRDLKRGGDLSDYAFAVNSNRDVGLGLDGVGLLESEVIGRSSDCYELSDVGKQKPM